MKQPYSFFMIMMGFCLFILSSNYLKAQCNSYTITQPSTVPDECDTSQAINIASFANSCQTMCIDLTAATASAEPIPACGSGSITNDIWLYVEDPYDNIPDYNGSIVFAWKDYPGYPNNAPTVNTNFDINGTIVLNGSLTLGYTVDCSDGFIYDNALCYDAARTVHDNQVVLPPGIIPDDPAVNTLLLNSSSLITSATVNNVGAWFQIETFDNNPGTICLEVSQYEPGFTCGDPTVLNYAGIGLSEVETVSNCLCNTAQNSGYFTPANQPCPDAGGITTGTTAYYQVNAAYDCNQITVDISDWQGSGNLNVSILSNVVCPDFLQEDIEGNIGTYPGLVVDGSTSLANACMGTGDNLTTTTCVPAGTYYVLIAGNEDKATFTADITVSEDATTAPTIVQAKLWLEGPYNATSGMMNTGLRDNDLIDLEQPFNRPPWNYGGSEQVASASDFPTNTVDWILVEVRDDADNFQVLEQRAGLLLSDGTIADADGSVGMPFYTLTAGTSYYLSVKHRNHLALLGSTTVALPNASPYDFTDFTQIAGNDTQPVELSTGEYALRAGDVNGDGVITVADFNFYLSQTSSINMYLEGDLNLDRTVTVADFNLYQPNVSIIGIAQIRY